MKKKIIIIFVLLVLIIMISGITYSTLNAEANLSSNQNIAKFIFDAKKTNHIELALYDMKPGDSNDYNFLVSNNKEDNSLKLSSDVTIEYNIIVKTFHFIPLEIYLYKEGNDLPIMQCDESNSRNENNELVCKSSTQEMKYENEITDSYKLNIKFPEKYNTYEYSNLIDYIDLEIESYQKVG